MRSLAASLAVGLALILSACGGRTSQQDFIAHRYDFGTFGYAAGNRDLEVEVVGNPFPGADQAGLEDAVIAALQNSSRGAQTNFTTTPGEDARELYSTVIIFNPVRPVGVYEPCRGQVETGPTVERIEVRAAFCEGDRPLTVARSSIPAVDSPDDPAFQAMIRNLVPLLFPRRNPDRFDDDGGPGFLFLGGAFGFGSGLSIGVGAGF